MEKIKLSVSGISKAFGGINALDDINFELREGEVHALVGANGAGKSTLIRIINGAVIPDKGEIMLEGERVHINSPEDARKLGIAAVYQELSLVNTLSVAENIFMGNLTTSNKMISYVKWKDLRLRAKKYLDILGCNFPPDVQVRSLSLAQKQTVEIAKALATKAKVIIFDEPTTSLTDKEVTGLFGIIKGLTAQGYSIIYISHRLEELPLIADRITVFRDGKKVETLAMKDAGKEKIISLMVGNTRQHIGRWESKAVDEIVLSVRNYTMRPNFENISFDLRKGEILGITGLTGAGRTELAKAIFGIYKKDSGELYAFGKKQKVRSPADAIKLRIGFITENRKEEGLVPVQTLGFNISLAVIKKFFIKFIIRENKEKALCDYFIDKLSIKAQSSQQKISKLSGGNQQKVVISKWLATEPKILILDEPTRGVDVGAKSQIYAIIRQLIEEGLSVIIISSEIPEILEISERILVMSGGRLTGELSADRATQHEILDLATQSVIV